MSFIAALAFGLLAATTVAPQASASLPATGPTLYLVAIGDAGKHVAALQTYYRDSVHLHVEVLPPFTPPLSAWNARLNHWRVEDLAQALIENQEARLRSENAAVIAITPDDLESVREGWVFAWHTAARVGIVSYARMDPWNDQRREDPALRDTRLRRMVSRYVGLLALGLPGSSDLKSPVFDNIRSVKDLDGMSDDLLGSGFWTYRPLNDYRGPVELTTAAYVRRDADFRLDDVPRVSFERVYRSNDTQLRWQPFGVGTNHSYGSFLVGDSSMFATIDLILDDGTRITYHRVSPGTGYQGAVLVHDSSPSEYMNSRLSWRDSGWLLELTDGRSYRYPSCSPALARPCTVSGFRDRSGRELKMTTSPAGTLARIDTPNHKFLAFVNDDANRIASIRDDNGRNMTYTYDDRGRLTTVATAEGTVNEYSYDDHNRMLTATSRRLQELIGYDAEGRCNFYQARRTSYVDASGHEFYKTTRYTFRYEAGDAADPYVHAVTISDGTTTRRLIYDRRGYVVREEYGVGTPLEQITTYDRESQTEWVRGVHVTCGADARHAIVDESLTTGQAMSTIVTRTRVSCDSKLLQGTR